MKKKSLIIFFIAGAILLIWGVSTRNNLIENEEVVKNKWSDVENQYQRRADLIPNLVSVVKGYAAHEKATFEEVAKARSKASELSVSSDNLTSEKLESYKRTQGEVGAALGKLLVIAENYPELKANQSFLELQAQLEGTENRIAVERGRYNKSVNSYNTNIRRFPELIAAKIFGFSNMPYFESDSGSSKSPQADFK